MVIKEVNTWCHLCVTAGTTSGSPVCPGPIGVARGRGTEVGSRDTGCIVGRSPSWTWFGEGSLQANSQYRESVAIFLPREVNIAARPQLKRRHVIGESWASREGNEG